MFSRTERLNSAFSCGRRRSGGSRRVGHGEIGPSTGRPLSGHVEALDELRDRALPDRSPRDDNLPSRHRGDIVRILPVKAIAERDVVEGCCRGSQVAARALRYRSARRVVLRMSPSRKTDRRLVRVLPICAGRSTGAFTRPARDVEATSSPTDGCASWNLAPNRGCRR